LPPPTPNQLWYEVTGRKLHLPESVRQSGATRTLSIAHRRGRRASPMEVRPDVGASLAACLASEQGFEIGEPDVIRPSVAADRDRVAAMEVGAIDQDAAHSGLPHLGEGDLLRAAGERIHAPIVARNRNSGKPLDLVAE
jgi:hypothetical protein